MRTAPGLILGLIFAGKASAALVSIEPSITSFDSAQASGTVSIQASGVIGRNGWIPADFVSISAGDAWAIDISLDASEPAKPCNGGGSFVCTGFTGLTGTFSVGSFSTTLDSSAGPIGGGINNVRLLDGAGVDWLNIDLFEFSSPLIVDGRELRGVDISLRGPDLVQFGGTMDDVVNWTYAASTSHRGANIQCVDCTDTPPPIVPIPATVWLFGSGLIGLAGWVSRRQQA